MDGILWPRTPENLLSEFSCDLISSSFRKETRVTRQCLGAGRWAGPDLTSCTLREDSEPFLLLWFVIEANVSSNDTMMMGMGGFGPDGIPDTTTRIALEQQVVCVAN